MDLLKEGIEKQLITLSQKDVLERSIVHQCCIYGNLNMLKYLVSIWGKNILKSADKFHTTLSHFAGKKNKLFHTKLSLHFQARNGHLHILQYLKSMDQLSFEAEKRFQITPLELAVAMHHSECVDFLVQFASKACLDSALLSSCQEVNISQLL